MLGRSCADGISERDRIDFFSAFLRSPRVFFIFGPHLCGIVNRADGLLCVASSGLPLGVAALQ